ncbi:hypothetical protein GCM10027517_11750 [Phycicoccus ginsengisoli]
MSGDAAVEDDAGRGGNQGADGQGCGTCSDELAEDGNGDDEGGWKEPQRGPDRVVSFVRCGHGRYEAARGRGARCVFRGCRRFHAGRRLRTGRAIRRLIRHVVGAVVLGRRLDGAVVLG